MESLNSPQNGSCGISRNRFQFILKRSKILVIESGINCSDILTNKTVLAWVKLSTQDFNFMLIKLELYGLNIITNYFLYLQWFKTTEGPCLT